MSTLAYDPVTGLPRTTTQKYQAPAFQPFASSTPSPSTSALGAPAGTASSPAATSSGGTSGSQPGYGWILENDPIYQQILRDLAAQGIADENGAKAAAQRAIIAIGEVPEGLDPVYAQWIDDQTRTLARQNTEAGLSLSARIAKHNRDQLRQVKSVLAARGGLSSGELGHALGEEDLEYRQGRYDMTQKLVDTLSGISAGLAAAQRARAQAQAAAAGDAYGRGASGSSGSPAGAGGTGGGTSTGATTPPPSPDTREEEAAELPWWLKKERGFYPESVL